MPIAAVKFWCFRTCKWFKLGGLRIYESSRKEHLIKEKGKVIFCLIEANYHAIFDQPVRWETNVKIMNWVANESHLPMLQDYVRMQCIKKSSTIRITSKGDRPPPTTVFSFGSQDRQIKKFLKSRKFVLKGLQ